MYVDITINDVDKIEKLTGGPWQIAIHKGNSVDVRLNKFHYNIYTHDFIINFVYVCVCMR